MAGTFEDCTNHGSFVSLPESNCKKNYNYENICQFNNLNILLFNIKQSMLFKQDQFVLTNNTKVEAGLIHFAPLLEHEQTEIAEPVFEN